MKVVIKWGGLPRDRLPAYQAIETIERVERENLDYCREVFLCAKDCQNLRNCTPHCTIIKNKKTYD